MGFKLSSKFIESNRLASFAQILHLGYLRFQIVSFKHCKHDNHTDLQEI